MQNIQMVDLKTQYERIRDEIDAAIQGVIQSTAFINGEAVQQFSAELEYYLKTGYVIPCASGTDALQVALMSLDLEPGDEVITTPFTFVATAEVIALLGLKPVFVDVEPGTFNMDVKQVEDKITKRTKCIIPVHLFGQAVHMEPLIRLAQKHELKIVEDNAQAIGAEYTFSNQDTKKTGNLGDVSCTSFFPSKNLGGFGDGGAVCTNDEQLAEKLRMVVNHGSGKEKYIYQEIGVNSRLDAVQAAVLQVKLKNLDQYIQARKKAARFYDEALNDIPGLQIPERASYSDHVFHQYTLKVEEERDALKNHLLDNDIPNAIYYPLPLHLQPAYTYLGYERGDFPVSEQLTEKVLSLPMHTELSEEQLSYITKTIQQFFK